MKHMGLFIHDCRGSVLVIGLFILALLSILGSAATSTSRVDISIFGNERVLQEAFYAAETGLIEGELFVNDMTTEFDLDESNIGHYEKGNQKVQDMKWNTSDSIEVSTSKLPQSVDYTAANPRYTIEKRDYYLDSLVLGKPPTGVHLYNITSQGTGSSNHAKSILRTVFVRRFN